MRIQFPPFAVPARRVVHALCAAVIASLTPLVAAQAPSNAANQQRGEMLKLAFLTGHWSGPITIDRGPADPLQLTQSENIQFKLGGLVLLIEGKSTGADGNTQFEALATVAFDSASQSYRIRAYHDGNYLDAPLTVLADGFSWEYSSGSARIVNTMRLTAKGEWQESTDVSFGNNAPRPSVKMLLSRQK